MSQQQQLLFWEKTEEPVVIIAYVCQEIDSDLRLKITNLMINSDNKFFSLIKSDDEITIIIEKSLDNFTEFNFKEEYIAYTLLNTGSLMDEPGLVKKTATIFDHHKIPIMYTTTYNNNYLFIPKEYEEKVDKLVSDGLDYEEELNIIHDMNLLGIKVRKD